MPKKTCPWERYNLPGYVHGNQGAEKIDYIHGEDVLFEMGTVEGNVGLYPRNGQIRPVQTMILDGALPRRRFRWVPQKQRFYMECRRIQPAS